MQISVQNEYKILQGTVMHRNEPCCFHQRMLDFEYMLEKKDAPAPRRQRASCRAAEASEAGNYVHGMMNRPKYFVEHHWTRGGRR